MRRLGGTLIKLFVAVLVYAVLLSPGILFDMIYKGKLQLLVGLVNWLVKLARRMGLSYSVINNLLADSLGMLITGIGLPITVGIHIAT